MRSLARPTARRLTAASTTSIERTVAIAASLVPPRAIASDRSMWQTTGTRPRRTACAVAPTSSSNRAARASAANDRHVASDAVEVRSTQISVGRHSESESAERDGDRASRPIVLIDQARSSLDEDWTVSHSIDAAPFRRRSWECPERHRPWTTEAAATAVSSVCREVRTQRRERASGGGSRSDGSRTWRREAMLSRALTVLAADVAARRCAHTVPAIGGSARRLYQLKVGV